MKVYFTKYIRPKLLWKHPKVQCRLDSSSFFIIPPPPKKKKIGASKIGLLLILHILISEKILKNMFAEKAILVWKYGSERIPQLLWIISRVCLIDLLIFIPKPFCSRKGPTFKHLCSKYFLKLLCKKKIC